MSGYTFKTISVPGAATTAANGINDKGQIVGSFWDASGHEYGFIDSAGGFATISVAGAASVAANGINDLGAVVGTFTDSAGVTHGFLDNGGTIVTINAPGAVGTAADAINDQGQIVGSFLSPKSPTDPAAVGPAVNGFLRDPAGGFTTIVAGRNDGFQGVTQPYPFGINDSGVIVGTTQLAPGGQPQAWEYTGTTLEPLPTIAGAMGTGATDVNNNGLIVGWYGVADAGTIPDGATFLDNNGTLTEITLPGTPHAINNQGQIVGSANGEGFLATPAASLASSPATNDTSCLRAGTPVLAEHGPVPVEALRPGARLRTASGRLASVRWVGHRTVALRGHANPDGVVPVRFAAESLAPGVPRHDVWLSPDHAVLVGGVLIPAHRLANGATIRRDRRAARVTYVHVELDRHDIILADGMPAESYLDTGNRGQFDREAGVRPLFDGGAQDRLAASLAAYAERGCAKLCLDGPEVAAAHRMLVARAAALGWTRSDDPALAVLADGMPVPARQDADGTLAFALPAGTRHVRLRSRRFVPAQRDAAQQDGRVLGAALAVHLDGIAPPPAAFGRGWYAPEADWRWTDGDARLLLPPTRPGALLAVRCQRFGACYWLAPQAAAPVRRAAAG